MNKTEKINYDGCNPVVAKYLQENLSVDCVVWDYDGDICERETVIAYRSGHAYPYVTSGFFDYAFAEPVED